VRIGIAKHWLSFSVFFVEPLDFVDRLDLARVAMA
jgi:hypothetical protein